MFMTITNKDEYIQACDVCKLPILYDDRFDVKLFGNDVNLNDNPWLWHFHIKITDICNAKCSFCIEQNCKKNEQPKKALTNIDKMLKEMQDNNCLFSVSVTGGEPTLFPYFEELCDILAKYDIKFLTMNTNGYGLDKYVDTIDGLFDFVNISRHSISDQENNEIFRTKVHTIDELREIKKKYHKTKFRIQCVIGDKLHTPQDILSFIEAYDFADDYSFRRLMQVGDEFGLSYTVNQDEYFKVLDYAFTNWTFKEQTIQDYYVYEIYNYNNKDVTFSYSDMKMLREVEKTEKDNIFREFICHPDGTISGSWKKDCKIILS